MALYQHSIQLPDRGMKVLRFPLTRLLIAFAFIGLGYGLAGVLGKLIMFDDDQLIRASWWNPILSMILLSGFSLLGYWLFVSLFEGRQTTELFSRFIPNVGLGILLGFVFISLIMGIMAILGYYRMEGANPQSAIVPILAMSVTAGIVEEIMLRGYFFRIVEEGLGTWWSVVISALLFGFLHAWNPNATLISSLSIALTAGVVLALLFAISRNLWVVIGMHFAWNFTLGGIYGAPVSGGKVSGFFKATLEGPELLTGGGFGPEASIITMIVFSLFGIFLIFKTIKDGKVVKPMWRRTK